MSRHSASLGRVRRLGSPVGRCAPSRVRPPVRPCPAGAELDRPAEAGRLCTGSLYAMARRTADALTADGGTVLVLSARYGLIPLDRVIEPYGVPPTTRRTFLPTA
ncbi:DUF6884 domain-containing protein [Streptomyces sp. NPDC055078]